MIEIIRPPNWKWNTSLGHPQSGILAVNTMLIHLSLHCSLDSRRHTSVRWRKVSWGIIAHSSWSAEMRRGIDVCRRSKTSHEIFYRIQIRTLRKPTHQWNIVVVKLLPPHIPCCMYGCTAVLRRFLKLLLILYKNEIKYMLKYSCLSV